MLRKKKNFGMSHSDWIYSASKALRLALGTFPHLGKFTFYRCYYKTDWHLLDHVITAQCSTLRASSHGTSSSSFSPTFLNARWEDLLTLFWSNKTIRVAFYPRVLRHLHFLFRYIYIWIFIFVIRNKDKKKARAEFHFWTA